jgi:hypothetical protein
MTIAVDGQTIRQIDNVSWQAGMNGQQAMEQAYGSGAGYSFQLQYFGAQLGYEVVSIDNIAGQSGTDAFLFWEFSVHAGLPRDVVDLANGLPVDRNRDRDRHGRFPSTGGSSL